MKAVLVVSFGTSFDDTREKNITAVETEISSKGYKVYRAFTSNMIRRTLAKRGIDIMDVTQALAAMSEDGITQVCVLPTHLLYGNEYNKMLEMIDNTQEGFEVIKVAKPLLSDTQDMIKVLHAIYEETTLAPQEALVMMGHGTDHFYNTVYAAMDYMAKEQGLPTMFIGTVEAYPSVTEVVAQVKKAGYMKALLTPLMLVAGDHAVNDMASDEEDSWKTIFTAAGIDTRTQIKGLGEYTGIRSIYMEHLEEIL